MRDNLRRVIEEAAQAEGCRLDDLTVPNRKNDPYRLDTPSGHRNGKWVAEQLDLLDLTEPVRLRELHNRIVDHGKIRKPDGPVYGDTVADWKWLCKTAAPAGRWLAYTSFYTSLTDDHDEWVGFGRSQSPARPYKLVILGENLALQDVALPIAQRHGVSLHLSSGESIEIALFFLAENALMDGLALVFFTCTDCTPPGYRWSVSMARKVQAIRDQFFPDLQYRIILVTPQQVKTEIDSLMALRKDVLHGLITEAIQPFFDESLGSRENEALRNEDAAERMDLAQKINGHDLDGFEMGTVDLRPKTLSKAEPRIRAAAPANVLISSDMPFAEATRALRKHLGDEP